MAGSLARGEKVGIGASIGWNQVKRETEAYIGSPADTTTYLAGGSFSAGPGSDDTITIEATNDGFFGSFAVAGAYMKNDKKAGDEETAAAVAVALAANWVADTTAPSSITRR